MNGYNNIVRAPTVIQPVPIGQDEVVSFDTPPAVEYAAHFRSIEELEDYYESLKYVPIQRPSENFIFTEAADNYHHPKDSCPFCGRFYPSEMNAMDRGRHAFKICPYRPVRCQVTGKVMLAKDFLYLHMWTLNDPAEADTNRTGVWAWTNAVKRDREMRREAEERAMRAETLALQKQQELEEFARMTITKQLEADVSIRETQKRLAETTLAMAASTRELELITRRERDAARDAEFRATAAQENAKAWESAAEAVARREKMALLELEQRSQLRDRDTETEKMREREARLMALEKAREADEAAKRERLERQLAEERAARALESVTVWEEATDLLVKREQALLQDAEAARQDAFRRAAEANRALQEERAAREAAELRAKAAEEYLGRMRAERRDNDERELALRRASEAAAAAQEQLQRERAARREAELLAAQLDAKQRRRSVGEGAMGPPRETVVEYGRWTNQRAGPGPQQPVGSPMRQPAGGRRSRSPADEEPFWTSPRR